MQELDLSVGANSKCVNIYEFPTEKSQFPRDRDVEGGHTGCQVHIPQSGSEFLFACCVPKNLFVFDV